MGSLPFPIIDASGEGKKWVVGGVSRERFAEGRGPITIELLLLLLRSGCFMSPALYNLGTGGSVGNSESRDRWAPTLVRGNSRGNRLV